MNTNINYTAFIETLNCYNQLSNLANGRPFYDSFNNLLVAAQSKGDKFEKECQNCTGLFNKFIADVRQTLSDKSWKEQVEFIISNMNTWFNSSVKNLKLVYTITNLKGNEYESNLV